MQERRKREELRADLVGPGRAATLEQLQAYWELPTITATIQRLIDWAGERLRDRERFDALERELAALAAKGSAIDQRRQLVMAEMARLQPAPEPAPEPEPLPPRAPSPLGSGRFGL